MRNKIFLTLASVLMAGSMLAQDFTYQGINYTVLDASAKTVTTKAGTDNNHGHHDLSGSIVIPETVYDESNNAYTVTQIGDYSLTNNTEITELKLPKTLTSIGQFGLYGCGMEVLILPKSVESISYGGLSSCNNLTTLVIEGSPLFYVFSVNGSANISSIYCLSDTPPTFQAGAGGAFSNTNATVYVSAENLSTYQNNAEWKKFAKIEVGSYDIPTEPEQPSAGNVFRYVSDLSELGTLKGDKAEVVFVAPNGTKAMSTEFYTNSSNKKTGLASTSNFTDNGDGTITIGDDVAVITMTCVSYSPPYSNWYTFELMNGDNRGFMVGSTSSSPEMSFTASESGATEMLADLASTLSDGSKGYRFSYNRTTTAYNYLVYTNDAFQFIGSYTGQSYNEPYKIYVRDTSAVEPEEPIEPEQPTSNDFTLVTSLDQIGDQAEIIILDSQDAIAMGKEYRSGYQYYRNAVTDFVKNSDGTVTPGEPVCIATITKKDGGYVIFAPMASDPTKGYLQIDYTMLNTKDSEDQASVFTITIDEKTGVAFVKNDQGRYLGYFPSGPYFRGNTSTNESITHRNLKFYMRAASAEEPDPEEPIEPEQPTGNDFTLVTDVAQIGDEAEVIILDSHDDFAMGKEYYRQSASAQYQRTAVTDFVITDNGTVTPGEEVCIATITKKDNGYVIFAPIASNPAMGYLNVNTVLDTYDREDQASVLNITIDETTGVAIVTDGKYYMTAYSNNIQTFFDSNNSSDESGAHRNLKFYMRGSSTEEPEQPEEPETLDVPASIFMNVDEVHDLSVYLTDDAEVRTLAVSNVDWSSSNPEVTSVTADGAATGAGYGTAVITAKDGDKTLLSVNTYVGTTLTVVYPDGSKVEHHVPYNAKANVTILPSSRWRIISASHDGTDVTDAVKNGKYVSAEPLTGNSTITLAAEEYDEPTTGAEGIETGSDIRLLVNGRTLTITGADDNDTVGVYDLKGVAVYQGLSKKIELSDSGVYIVRVGTKVYKLAVL